MAETKPKPEAILIENANIRFRNFAGRERDFNSAGDRNFCVFVDPDQAADLKAAGWNVKQLRAREEGDIPQDYLQVKVSYKNAQRPPKCVLVSSGGRRDLGQQEVELLDAVDIKKVDLIVNPYEWTVNGNTGVKAYLKSIFVTINEDELDLKYALMDQVQGQSPTADLEEPETDYDDNVVPLAA